jgi:hypothetical protein
LGSFASLFLSLPIGLALGVGLGLIDALTNAFDVPIEIGTSSSPAELLAADRRYTLAQSLVFGLGNTLFGIFGGSLIFGQADGLAIGLAAGVFNGLVIRSTATAWGRWFVLTRIWIPVTGRLPWSVLAFLDDAHERGVLRQAGAVYQFRHARLQDRLAQAATDTT